MGFVFKRKTQMIYFALYIVSFINEGINLILNKFSPQFKINNPIKNASTKNHNKNKIIHLYYMHTSFWIYFTLSKLVSARLINIIGRKF